MEIWNSIGKSIIFFDFPAWQNRKPHLSSYGYKTKYYRYNTFEIGNPKQICDGVNKTLQFRLTLTGISSLYRKYFKMQQWISGEVRKTGHISHFLVLLFMKYVI